MQNDISKERKEYLNKLKRNKWAVIGTRIAILFFAIFLWEVLANQGIIDSFIMSKPSRIIQTFMNLSQNDLLKHLGTTCYETVIGFLLGTILGIFIAIILWWSKFLAKVFDPFLVVLNSLPKVALGPVIIIWVGARNICNNNDGNCNFTGCNNIRNFKWIYKYRQRKNKNGKNIWSKQVSNFNKNNNTSQYFNIY